MNKILKSFFLYIILLIPTSFAINYVFTDQESFKDSWFEKSVLKLNDQGIINGYKDGSFKPNNNVTRAELAVIIDRLQNYELATNLAYGFKAWSESQGTTEGMLYSVAQEIEINDLPIIVSGPNAGGNSDPLLSEDAIDNLLELISVAGTEKAYTCLHELSNHIRYPHNCDFLGEIKMQETAFGEE